LSHTIIVLFFVFSIFKITFFSFWRCEHRKSGFSSGFRFFKFFFCKLSTCRIQLSSSGIVFLRTRVWRSIMPPCPNLLTRDRKFERQYDATLIHELIQFVV
jgi:hypothetical protein